MDRHLSIIRTKSPALWLIIGYRFFMLKKKEKTACLPNEGFLSSAKKQQARGKVSSPTPDAKKVLVQFPALKIKNLFSWGLVACPQKEDSFQVALDWHEILTSTWSCPCGSV